jgi:hypothetical protein
VAVVDPERGMLNPPARYKIFGLQLYKTVLAIRQSFHSERTSTLNSVRRAPLPARWRMRPWSRPPYGAAYTSAGPYAPLASFGVLLVVMHRPACGDWPTAACCRRSCFCFYHPVYVVIWPSGVVRSWARACPLFIFLISSVHSNISRPGDICTPSVYKYKMFYLCKVNVSRHLLVDTFTRIYTPKLV